MKPNADAIVLQNAHVIDPAQGIDKVVDVIISDGKIAAVGGPVPPGAKRIDLSGHYISPGWVDIHVHAYGTLGFADPDSIGICQGVTTFVEAGGPGIETLDEFVATMSGTLDTDLFVGAFIRPLGILGLAYLEGELRSLDDIPIAKWLDFAAQHPGLIRYLKMGAFNEWGAGPLRMGKGLSEVLNVPLYVHIGEFHVLTDKSRSLDIFDVADKGDIITHLYHQNPGNILDEKGMVLPAVRKAQQRGVLYDIGFGGNNFSWDVAEKGFAQGIVPDIISSDLQQFNVTGPVYSLANIMTLFRRLGLSLPQVIERVTKNAASALKLSDRAGCLGVGMPADITVFRIEQGDFQLADCHTQRRLAHERIVPVMAFKKGKQFVSDLTRCLNEANWIMSIAEDHVPEAAGRLSKGQIAFLRALDEKLQPIDWDAADQERLSLSKASQIKAVFEDARRVTSVSTKDALKAIFGCFLDSTFNVQIALFLMRMERRFVSERIRQVAGTKRKTSNLPAEVLAP